MPIGLDERTMSPLGTAQQGRDFESSAGQVFGVGVKEGLRTTSMGAVHGLAEWYDGVGNNAVVPDEESWKSSSYHRPGLKYQPGITWNQAQLLATREDSRRHDEFIMTHAKSTGSAALLNISGNIVGHMVDPLIIGPLIFFGVLYFRKRKKVWKEKKAIMSVKIFGFNTEKVIQFLKKKTEIESGEWRLISERDEKVRNLNKKHNRKMSDGSFSCSSEYILNDNSKYSLEYNQIETDFKKYRDECNSTIRLLYEDLTGYEMLFASWCYASRQERIDQLELNEDPLSILAHLTINSLIKDGYNQRGMVDMISKWRRDFWGTFRKISADKKVKFFDIMSRLSIRDLKLMMIDELNKELVNRTRVE